MDIGYSSCKCYFRLVTFYFITYYYETGDMLGVIGLKLCHKPLATLMGGLRAGIRQILQMAACWSPYFL